MSNLFTVSTFFFFFFFFFFLTVVIGTHTSLQTEVGSWKLQTDFESVRNQNVRSYYRPHALFPHSYIYNSAKLRVCLHTVSTYIQWLILDVWTDRQTDGQTDYSTLNCTLAVVRHSSKMPFPSSWDNNRWGHVLKYKKQPSKKNPTWNGQSKSLEALRSQNWFEKTSFTLLTCGWACAPAFSRVVTAKISS